MNNILETKAIGELLALKFKIPSYQRGYRWENIQVKALLNDLNKYEVDHSNPNTFYCLQPVVVKEDENNRFELIDGQQRLTTILLILHYLNETEFKLPKPIYDLTFETRVGQTNFLSVVNDSEICKNDIDLFHLNQAYNTIGLWFDNQEKVKPSVKGDFYSVLTNKVRVIWYCINDGTSVIDIFTRLNIGKIPLTNSELIKALFLIKSNFEQQASLKQIQIATEWDIIEKKLQDDSLWYFIYNPQNSISYDNRIEFIFDLLQHKKRDHEDYFTFNKFYEQFEKSKIEDGHINIDKHWLKVKQYFQAIEEWYHNRELFHLIGFLIETGIDLNSLITKSKEINKTDFITHLKKLVKLKLTGIDLDKLDYTNSNDKRAIKMVLLLFNIQTILSTEKAEMRFPFNRFKKDKWDLEHISSQTDKRIDAKKRKLWALDLLEFYTGLNLTNDSEQYYNQEETLLEIIQTLEDGTKDICKNLIAIFEAERTDDEVFDKIFNEIRKSFEEDKIKDINSISNLSLLDESTNRSYGNAMFPIKRKRIIENDKSGLFVPICTKNLFLKYYSKQIKDSMHWKQTDADDYLKAIKEALNEYFKNQN
jgi:hypothetical protein